MRQYSELALFTEVLPRSQATPAPPRFIFGAMPAAVANEYFSQQFLRPIGLFTARDITIGEGPCLYFDNDILTAPELNLRPEEIKQGPALHEPPAPGARIDGPHALIVGKGYHIYGHWIAEILPKLGVLQAGGLDLESMRLLLPHDTPGFALEMLRLLGFDESRFVRFGGAFGGVTVGELIATSFLHNSVRYAACLEQSVKVLRDRVERNFGPLTQGGYPARLCIARRGGNRPCSNRAMFERDCADAGFHIVAPESLPLLEQWRMFAGAREIIGEYGSALHGAIFSPPGTIVCGLRGSSMHPGFIQSGMGEQLLQPTGYVFGVNETDSTGPFRIDQTDLRACVRQVFSGAKFPLRAPARAIPEAPINSAEGFLAAHDEYLAVGQLEEAHRSLRNALRRDANAPGAKARLARLLDRMGVPGALAAIDEAIAGGEAIAPNFALRAKLLLREERNEDALQAASEAARLAPESADAWSLSAKAALRAGRAASEAA
jgi:capsular polysaccharide biosynthesis protein